MSPGSSTESNLPRSGIEPGSPGFAAGLTNRYSAGVDCSLEDKANIINDNERGLSQVDVGRQHSLSKSTVKLLRNNRYHKVRSSIANTLREVYEDVHCLVENGSTRAADTIAINRRNQRSLIFDPTVRFEKDDQQVNNVNDEKKSIYSPCIPHFNLGLNSIEHLWDELDRRVRRRSYSNKAKQMCRCVQSSESLMLAGNEFQSLGRAIVKEDVYEEVRWDGIVSIVSWRERVFRLWREESSEIGVIVNEEDNEEEEYNEEHEYNEEKSDDDGEIDAIITEDCQSAENLMIYDDDDDDGNLETTVPEDSNISNLNVFKNITTDNFFTSLDLVKELEIKQMTLLGTIRKNCKGKESSFKSVRIPGISYDNNVYRLDLNLNPIEHLWDELDRRLRSREMQPTSIVQLSDILQKEWRHIPVDILQKLVESMPDMVAAVTATRGGTMRF
ncbi:hypothetical protein ANN_13888 [Periplaneta americana]|uniref:Uncharacterized protein n=1 Tax=Periplaneta americana TaxID=6978 RepID=A0ABQ8SUS6_PERAM|nr:hypothetical protein ANN_13888 [Periplaneta americana]